MRNSVILVLGSRLNVTTMAGQGHSKEGVQLQLDRLQSISLTMTANVGLEAILKVKM